MAHPLLPHAYMSVASATPPRVLPGASRVGSAEPRATTFASALKQSLASTPTVEVSKVATPLTGTQAARALSHAWQQRFGHTPTRDQLSLLLAQWSLETGGGSAMIDYNFGGIKGKSPAGMTVSYGTTEGHGETERHMVGQFRAYRNADEGARDYLDVLARRYPEALERVKAADASGFVSELKRAGYFTGSEEVYAKNVRGLFQQAQTAGFDAVGRSSSPAPQAAVGMVRHLQQPQALPTLGAMSYLGMGGASAAAFPLVANSGAQASFADSLAFADELARLATRIASTTAEDREDDPNKLRTW